MNQEQTVQPSVGERTVRKVMRRIIPFIFLLYIVAFLDRVNLGYAALEMNQALGLSAEVFGLVSGNFSSGTFYLKYPAIS